MCKIQSVNNWDRQVSRRGFLHQLGIGSVAFFGTSLINQCGLTLANPIVSKEKQYIDLTTHEYYGDIDERFSLPAGWDVKVYHMAGASRPALSSAEIQSAINRPIGAKTLREIAAGKKTAVITFDDLTRPTPIDKIAPHVVAELEQVGLRQILFLGSYGNHSIMSRDQIQRKLGLQIVKNYPWMNHNAWDNLKEVGVTSFGNKIWIDSNYLNADVKITISGVKGHSYAGFGGGSKAILPGVAGIETVAYNHMTIRGAGHQSNPTIGLGKIYQNDARLDMNEAARLTGVDFGVQVIYGPKRDVIAVYAGDIEQAWHDACKDASNHYQTEICKDADVVITNAYPRCQQGMGALSWARESVREGGSVVFVMQSPMMFDPWHYLRERRNYRGQSYWDDLGVRQESSSVQSADQIIVYSQYIHKRDMNLFDQKNVRFTDTWETVLEHLNRKHGTSTRVAVYPYGSIQHPGAELDG